MVRCFLSVILAILIAAASPLCCCRLATWTGFGTGPQCVESIPTTSLDDVDLDLWIDPSPCSCCEHSATVAGDHPARKTKPCDQCPSCSGESDSIIVVKPAIVTQPAADWVMMDFGVPAPPPIPQMAWRPSPPWEAVWKPPTSGREVLRWRCALTL